MSPSSLVHMPAPTQSGHTHHGVAARCAAEREERRWATLSCLMMLALGMLLIVVAH